MSLKKNNNESIPRPENNTPEQYNGTSNYYNDNQNDNGELSRDNIEIDKKTENQNYSGKFRANLGDLKENSYYSNLNQQKNISKLNTNKNEQKKYNEHEYQRDIIPHIQYFEYNNHYDRMEESQLKNLNKMIDKRTQKMMEALRNQSDYYSEQSRNHHKKIPEADKNNINNPQKSKISKHSSNEQDVEMIIRDYRLQGYKYSLIKTSEKKLKEDLHKEGYQIISLKLIQDPISRDPNGQITLRARLCIDKEEEFEEFMQEKLNWMIMGKK